MNSPALAYPRLPSSREKSRPVISFGSGRGEWKSTTPHVKFLATGPATTPEHQSQVFQFLTGSGSADHSLPRSHVSSGAVYVVSIADARFNEILNPRFQPFGTLREPFSLVELDSLYGKVRSNVRKFTAHGGTECVIEVEQELFSEAHQKPNFEFARTILDANSMERLASFAQLSQGWHLGDGKALQIGSVTGFKTFLLASSKKLNLRSSSVFMTQEGYLQLSWDDDEGGYIELEFHPSRVEYYLEKTNEESESSYGELNQLIEKLSKIEKKTAIA